MVMLTGCPKQGCTDPKALNYNYRNKKDDGTCQYSKVIFYASGYSTSGFWIGLPNPPYTLYINGSPSGQITASYPNGPGNCSATGCPTYQFESGTTVDWEVRDGAGYIWTGSVSPSSTSECIKIRVY